MSSFKRKKRASKRRARRWPGGTPLRSLGVRGWNKLSGGGLPVGCCAALQSDPRGQLQLQLLRCYAAEALASGERLLVVGMDSEDELRSWLQELPWMRPQLRAAGAGSEASEAKSEDKADSAPAGDAAALKIAWQYEKYSRAADTPSKSDFCHSFDMRTRVPADVLAAEGAVDVISVGEAAAPLRSAVEEATRWLTALPASASARLLLMDFGSPDWFSHDCSVVKAGAAVGSGARQLLAAARGLRSAVRRSEAGAVCLASLPAHLLPLPLCRRFCHSMDSVWSLRSFAGSGETATAEFADLHGFLTCLKLPRLHALAAGGVDCAEMGVRRSLRRLAVEKLHLQPESSRSLRADDAKSEMAGAGSGRASQLPSVAAAADMF